MSIESSSHKLRVNPIARYKILKSTLIALAFIFPCVVASATADSGQTRDAALSEMRSKYSVSLDRDGLINFVKGDFSDDVPAGSHEDRVRAFFVRYKDAYGIDREADELRPVSDRIDKALALPGRPVIASQRILTFEQVHMGIPVWGAWILAYFAEDGQLKVISGSFHTQARVNTIPSITEHSAKTAARTMLDPGADPQFTVSELRIMPRSTRPETFYLESVS